MYGKQQYELQDNTGTTIHIPSTVNDDFDYFQPGDTDAIHDYYSEYGYVVVRNLIPANALDKANEAFDRQVLPSSRHIYRQTTANPERHSFTEAGYMINPILNVQSIDPRHYKTFRLASEQVFTSASMQSIISALFGQPGKLVQTMYFQGNPSTWPHQDTYYLDSEQLGTMVAAWFAAEDIAPGAGRFFVYPESHKIDLQKHGGDFDIAFHHDRYKKLIKDLIREKHLECPAPALAKGDVLLWNARTIHGSLPTTQPALSRRSFTSHYIPQSHRFMQFQSRIKQLPFSEVNGMLIGRPKDQASFKNRTILYVETRFPKAFQFAKKLAIKAVTK